MQQPTELSLQNSRHKKILLQKLKAQYLKATVRFYLAQRALLSLYSTFSAPVTCSAKIVHL